MPTDYYILCFANTDDNCFRAVPVESNHTYIVPALWPLNGLYKVGNIYDGQPNLIVTEVLFRPRRWWQFWKKKNQAWGYKVECKEFSYEDRDN